MIKRLIYIAEDSVIGIDGEFYKVDLQLEENLRAVQWYGDYGEAELSDGSANKPIKSINDLSHFIAAWELAKIKSNPPNEYSIYDHEMGGWVEDEQEKELFERRQRGTAARKYLEETDFKMLSDYIPRQDGEPLEEIIAKRAAARETIRDLEKSRRQ